MNATPFSKVNVSALTGAALDWAVATCEGLPIQRDPMAFSAGSESGYWIWDERTPTQTRYQLIGREYSPSSNWSQAGPIMDAHDIFPSRYYACAENNPNEYQAGTGLAWVRGETPIQAAMRSVVASVFGDEIEVPSALIDAMAQA